MDFQGGTPREEEPAFGEGGRLRLAQPSSLCGSTLGATRGRSISFVPMLDTVRDALVA